MRPGAGWRLTLAVAVLGGALVVPALAQQPTCPPNSNNPRCGTDPDGTGGSTTDGDSPRTAPTQPPGQVRREPAPDATSPNPPGTQPAPAVVPEADDDVTENAPPDLGPLRVLHARTTTATDGSAALEVVVDEHRAGGVDGGWTVTVDVDGAALSGAADAWVDPVSTSAGVARAGRVGGQPGFGTLFTVVGQRSEQRYEATYGGRVALELAASRPTVTVTLFQ